MFAKNRKTFMCIFCLFFLQPFLYLYFLASSSFRPSGDLFKRYMVKTAGCRIPGFPVSTLYFLQLAHPPPPLTYCILYSVHIIPMSYLWLGHQISRDCSIWSSTIILINSAISLVLISSAKLCLDKLS